MTGASPDNLDEAQRLMRYPQSPQLAIALALIDIGQSLRDIRDMMKDFDEFGLPVKKKTP